MEQRITLITLATHDLARSTRFYEALGWRRAAADTEGVSFFQCGCMGLALYPAAALAAEVQRAVPTPGGGDFALAYNTRSRAEVDRVLAEALAAGGDLVKPAEETFWGGYAGYFSDPDGHLWEVAWNPGFPLDDQGAVRLPA